MTNAPLHERLVVIADFLAKQGEESFYFDLLEAATTARHVDQLTKFNECVHDAARYLGVTVEESAQKKYGRIRRRTERIGKSLVASF